MGGGHGRLHRSGLQIVGPRRMFAHGRTGGGGVGCIRGGSWEAVQGVVLGGGSASAHLRDALREAERHIVYLRGHRLARRIRSPTR